jgi:predicted transcriptional regulator
MPRKVVKKVEKKEGEEKEFRIEQLFGSKTRVRLLSLFLEHKDRPFYVREITRKIDAQLNSVRRELQNLVELNIVLEVKGTIFKNEAERKKSEKKKFYKANADGPFFKELRSIMKKSLVLMNRTFAESLEKHGSLDLLLLTGRFVDNSDVATDLLVVGGFDQDAVEQEISNFEKVIAREVNYTFMPREEFMYRLEVKDRFVLSLLESDNVVMVNKISEKLI